MQGFHEFTYKRFTAGEDIYSLAIGRSGKHLATGYFYSGENPDKTGISLWDTESFTRKQDLRTHPSYRYPNKLIFTGDERSLAVIGDEQYVELISIEDKTVHKIETAHPVDLTPIEDNQFAISGNSCRIWKASPPSQIQTIENSNPDTPILLQYGCRTKSYYLANWNPDAITITNTDLVPAGKLTGASSGVQQCRIDVREMFLYCHYVDNSGEAVWDIYTGKKLMNNFFTEQSGPASVCIAFHEKLPLIARGTKRGIVLIIDLSGEKIVSMQSLSEFPVRDLVFHPHRNELYVATGDGSVFILNLSGLKIIL